MSFLTLFSFSVSYAQQIRLLAYIFSHTVFDPKKTNKQQEDTSSPPLPLIFEQLGQFA